MYYNNLMCSRINRIAPNENETQTKADDDDNNDGDRDNDDLSSSCSRSVYNREMNEKIPTTNIHRHLTNAEWNWASEQYLENIWRMRRHTEMR